MSGSAAVGADDSVANGVATLGSAAGLFRRHREVPSERKVPQEGADDDGDEDLDREAHAQQHEDVGEEE